jgi:uncharacterized membrane protein YtjA (UPF0391 family)
MLKPEPQPKSHRNPHIQALLDIHTQEDAPLLPSRDWDTLALDEPGYGEPSTAPGSPDQPIKALPQGTLEVAPALFTQPNLSKGASPMGNLMYYAVVFLVVALVAAAFGFGGLAGTAVEGAKILFWVAIVLFGISFVAGVVRRN